MKKIKSMSDKTSLLTIAPTRIYDGENILNKALLKNFYDIFGKNPVIIAKNDVLIKFPQIKNLDIKIIKFDGECSYEQTSKILKKLDKSTTSVIGIGGGKAIDQAKFVAHKLSKPSIPIPTTPSQGAPASALSAMYTENGASLGYEIFDKAPDLVVLDYAMIIESPSEFFSFGIADALAKYYESMASTGGNNKADDFFTETALNIAVETKNYLLKNSKQALKDAKNKKITQILKNIIKINVIIAPIIGGFGGENCRAVAAHALNNAMTQIPRMRRFMHGEMVAFGNLFQLKLQNKRTELVELLKFYKTINLMQDFAYFGKKLNKQELEIFMEHLTSKKETLKNMPFNVKKDEILKSLKDLKVI